jgi:peptidoglycan/LPS O-acetylase OafA/YrhL
MSDFFDNLKKISNADMSVDAMRRMAEETRHEVETATPEEKARAEFIRTPPVSLREAAAIAAFATAAGAVPIVTGHLLLGQRPDAQINTVTLVLSLLLGAAAYFYYFRRLVNVDGWSSRGQGLVMALFMTPFVVYGQLVAALIGWLFF